MVKFITEMSEFEALKNGDKLLVLDFTASWCPPCRMIAPVFEKLAGENPEAVFAKVDVDDAQEIAASCGISCMPTFQFFKGGKMVAKLEGANQAALVDLIAKHK